MTAPMGDRMTLAAYAHLWLSRERPRWKTRTRASYADTLRLHLLPALGGPTPLDSLTRAAIVGALTAKLDAGYSRPSVRTMLAVLRAMLATAHDVDGLIPTNPAARLGYLLPRRHGARRAEAVPPPELADLFAAAARYHPALARLFLVMQRTGLRLGEALALQWPDVDLLAGVVTVRRNDWRTPDEEPKGNRARTVDLSPEAATTLREMAGRRDPALPWVFHGPRGVPWSRSWLRRVLERSALEARVGRVTPKALRRTFATELRAAHVDLDAIRDLLGHASVRETEGYVETPRRHQAAVALLDRRRR